MFTVAETMRDRENGEAVDLVRGLHSRDPELLDQLIEQYHYRLFRYLVFLTGRREIAEDLFQESWMRVLERGHQYNGKSRFESWLFSIAHNLFVDMVRRRKASVSLDELCDLETGGCFVPSDNSAMEPVERIIRDEEDSLVTSALSRLPAGFREVLVLRFHEDLSLEEIAAIVSSPLPTVKSRLYRGLEKLREALEGVPK